MPIVRIVPKRFEDARGWVSETPGMSEVGGISRTTKRGSPSAVTPLSGLITAPKPCV